MRISLDLRVGRYSVRSKVYQTGARGLLQMDDFVARPPRFGERARPRWIFWKA